MRLALDLIGGFYALIAVGSASGKLTKNPQVIASLTHVGVKDSFVKILAFLEILGGVGLAAGIAAKWLGLAAAIGLTLFFLGAIIAHLRVKDAPKNIVPPFVLFALGVVVTLLEAHR